VPDRPLADLITETIALREGQGECMSAESILELRASAMLQLLTEEDKMKLFTSARDPAQVASIALVSLERTYKKLLAIKQLASLEDPGGSWPSI